MSTTEVTLIPYVTNSFPTLPDVSEVSAESVETEAEHALKQAKNRQSAGLSRQIDATVRKIELTLNCMKQGLLSPKDAKAKIDVHLQTISSIYNRFQSQSLQYDAEKRTLGEQFRQVGAFRGTQIPDIAQPVLQPQKTGRELLAGGLKATQQKADASLAASIQAKNAMKAREYMVLADVTAKTLRGIGTVVDFGVQSVCTAGPVHEKVCQTASEVGTFVKGKTKTAAKEVLRAVGALDFVTQKLSTKPHAFIMRLKELGISESEANQYLADSQLIRKTAFGAVTGLGAIRLAQTLPAATAKVSNVLSQATAKKPPAFSAMRVTVEELERHRVVAFEIERLNESTSIAYLKLITDQTNSGTFLNTINRMKQIAAQHGSSELILQGLWANTRLFDILSKRYTYVGKKPHHFYGGDKLSRDTFLIPVK